MICYVRIGGVKYEFNTTSLQNLIWIGNNNLSLFIKKKIHLKLGGGKYNSIRRLTTKSDKLGGVNTSESSAIIIFTVLLQLCHVVTHEW